MTADPAPDPSPHPASRPAPRHLPWRARLAVRAVASVNDVSRRFNLGRGTVAGGRVGLAIDGRLVTTLAGERPVGLVTGTNGKTTTTALLVAAITGVTAVGAGRSGPSGSAGSAGSAGSPDQSSRRLVTNSTGSNMPAGHAAALAAGARLGELEGPAVLEVDEAYLPMLVRQTRPIAVVLLNLSRDQLDRNSEVRMVAAKWRSTLAEAGPATVVANADDPLVAWAAGAAPKVRWVAAGCRWVADAAGCPACEGRITYHQENGGGSGWSCDCGFERPTPDVTVVDTGTGGLAARWSDGSSTPISLSIPGRFNGANALMAAVAAECFGVPIRHALEAMASVTEVAGRFSIQSVGGVAARLLLAKNPAGWVELLDLLEEGDRPLVLAINARVADGRDPSWLWDVPYERLAGRRVVASGERAHDLAVRLHYAEVEHDLEPDPVQAVRRAAGWAGSVDGARVDFAGNYTAFHDVWQPPS